MLWYVLYLDDHGGHAVVAALPPADLLDGLHSSQKGIRGQILRGLTSEVYGLSDFLSHPPQLLVLLEEQKQELNRLRTAVLGASTHSAKACRPHGLGNETPSWPGCFPAGVHHPPLPLLVPVESLPGCCSPKKALWVTTEVRCWTWTCSSPSISKMARSAAGKTYNNITIVTVVFFPKLAL
ncbi:hypothetical protein AOLI_G00276860 [Acnodon oligacanthus]